MRLPRPSRAQLGAGALVLAALSLGRVVTEWLPEGPSPVRPFERATTVGHPAHLRYADVVVSRVDGGRQLSTTTEAMLSPDLWVTVEAEVTPTLDNTAFGWAELRDGRGRVVSLGTRNVLRCELTNPGIPGHCITAFEVDHDALPGSHLVLGRFADDQRGDDQAVVDLGITRADVTQWRARTTPVELALPEEDAR